MNIIKEKYINNYINIDKTLNNINNKKYIKYIKYINPNISNIYLECILNKYIYNYCYRNKISIILKKNDSNILYYKNNNSYYYKYLINFYIEDYISNIKANCTIDYVIINNNIIKYNNDLSFMISSIEKYYIVFLLKNIVFPYELIITYHGHKFSSELEKLLYNYYIITNNNLLFFRYQFIKKNRI